MLPKLSPWQIRLCADRFAKVHINTELVLRIRELATHADILYIGPRCGQLDYLYFNYLCVTHQLPRAHYAQHIATSWWSSWRQQWRDWRKPHGQNEIDIIQALLNQRRSALLQIRTSALYDDSLWHDPQHDTLQALHTYAQTHARPIYLVPIQMLWGTRPEGDSLSLMDSIFGTAANPKSIRKLFQFLRPNMPDVACALSEPMHIDDCVDATSTSTTGQQIRRAMLDHFAKWRKSFTGPRLQPQSWMMSQTMESPQVQRCIYETAQQSGKTQEDIEFLCKQYCREIAANTAYAIVEVAGRLVAWGLRKLYDGIEYDVQSFESVRHHIASGPVIFVPNHQSHIDALLLSYTLYKHNLALPHIAAGINMAFWPMGPIFRRCGAFFLRRKFSDNPLYRACFESYVHTLIQQQHSVIFFIEGGRSRTGKSLKPRMGMLSMLGEAWRLNRASDITFIPVNMTHDRVLEHQAHTREARGHKKLRESLWSLRHVTQLFKRRHGRVYIQFGDAISYSAVAATHLQTDTDRQTLEKSTKAIITNDLGQQIIRAINQQAVVTPTALIATAALQNSSQTVLHTDLLERCQELLRFANARHAHCAYALRHDNTAALTHAINHLCMHGSLTAHRDFEPYFYTIPEHQRALLHMQRNGIASLYILAACVAHILFARRAPVHVNIIHEQVMQLTTLLAHEFSFAQRETVILDIDHILEDFGAQQAIVSGDQQWTTGPRASLLTMHAAWLTSLLESYAHVWHTAEQWLHSPMTHSAFLNKTIAYAAHRQHLGRLRSESVSSITFRHAISCYMDNALILENAATPEPLLQWDGGTSAHDIFRTILVPWLEETDA